jgi:hypothetical protein
MKKILSIILGLALVLSLSMAAATSVAAAVSGISVNVSPNNITMPAEYVINFTIAHGLTASSHWIKIQFPSGTTVPNTGWGTGNVTVEDHDVASAEISVSGQVVTITVPENIDAEAEVNVVFTEDFGIINPNSSGNYHLYVWTSRDESGTSQDYFISLLNESTYEFDYDVPDELWVETWAEVDVTLRTKVEGDNGYDDVLITFNVTEPPGGSEVMFEVYSGGAWQPRGVNSGNWTPDGGSLDPVYNQTFPFRLKFDEVGMYTIKFVLLTDPDGAADGIAWHEAIWAVTGVSVNVTLNKGWNLMSLPVVPDNPVIEELLADIMDDVISVWYYDAATVDWDSFDPDPELSSDLEEMKDGKAYWINMSEERTLTVIGQAIAAPGHGTPQTYEVVEGWNMIGFKSMYPMPANEYLAGTDSVRVYGFNLTQGGWFSLSLSEDDGGEMKRGLGYWVAFSDEGTIYP